MSFLKKVWRTIVVVRKYMPDVVKELTELTGVTRVMVVELIDIWKLQ